MFDTKKTKEYDLSTGWKIMYFTGALALKKVESEKFEWVFIKKMKFRLIHPIGIIMLLILFVLLWVQWVKEEWDDFCIF